MQGLTPPPGVVACLSWPPQAQSLSLADSHMSDAPGPAPWPGAYPHGGGGGYEDADEFQDASSTFGGSSAASSMHSAMVSPNVRAW